VLTCKLLCWCCCVQGLHCVEVMSLLMRQYLRDKVEASLLHYQEFWQAHAIPQGSRVAYAGACPASSHVHKDCEWPHTSLALRQGVVGSAFVYSAAAGRASCKKLPSGT
jgi:hypothetical protein